ncbi:MAG: hypothetical protein Q9220_004596, partial [cf. Caloplaca sp. 1 TL-2023]
MRLPPELRMIVYEKVFEQESESHRFCCPSCENRWYNRSSFHWYYKHHNDVPARNLWTVSKKVYDEAMPIYFRTRMFALNDVRDLERFLTKIGPFHRQYIRKLRFDLEKPARVPFSVARRAFELLAECASLRELYIFVRNTCDMCTHLLPGLQTLLQIRGIKMLCVNFSNGCSRRGDPDFNDENEKVYEMFEPLLEPHSPAAIEEREARGITVSAGYRASFEAPEPETRAERYERRKRRR